MSEVILGNSNARFSGVTSTMLATLPGVSEKLNVSVLGSHFLPEEYDSLTPQQFLKLLKSPTPDGKPRLFHARRNDEMIQALLARAVTKAPLKIIFTSTAQRHHSGFTRWLMSKMDGVISTCEAAAGFLQEPPDALIPHGVDLEEFSPAEDREALWESFGHGGEFGIGVFGRVRASKGTDLLVRSAISVLKKDSRPTVVIIGETKPSERAFQEELQREIDEAGLTERILFLGKLPFSEVKKYFQGVSLVTALSRNEGFGLTVLEAMASGAAVMATRAGAWEEILEPFPECLIPEHEVPAVQETLERILTMDLKEMGQRNRAYVEEHYPIKKEVDALLSYYKSVRGTETDG